MFSQCFYFSYNTKNLMFQRRFKDVLNFLPSRCLGQLHHTVSFASVLLFLVQHAWSLFLLPLPLPSCTRTLTWTVTKGRAGSRGRIRSAGSSWGLRMAPWGMARGRWGPRSREKSSYSKRGGGSSQLPSHSSSPSRLLFPLRWSSTQKPHTSPLWRQTGRYLS